MNVSVPDYDMRAENDRCLDLRSRRLIDKLGFTSREEIDEIAIEATRTALSQVISLANVVGVQDDILDGLESDSPSLVLPGFDRIGVRYEITHGYGVKKTTQLKPSVQFLRQALFIAQIAYDDTFGIVDSIDARYVKSEAIGYTYKFGAGLRLAEIAKEHIAPNQSIFSQQDHKKGVHSLAGFFALMLAKPLPKLTVYDTEHDEYVTNFSARAPTIRGVLQGCQPKRAKEFDDECSFGIERPMTFEEARLFAKTSKDKQKPILQVVV